MGFFDFLKRPKIQGTALRDALINAVDRNDSKELLSLLQKHHRRISREFKSWRKVPDPIRADQQAADRYCRGIMAVAELFEKAGDRSLIELLIGNESTNPLMAWHRDLAKAKSLIDDGRPAKAVTLLTTVLERTAGLQGTGVDRYLPRTLGLLGIAHYRAGNKAQAVECTEKARALCEELDDKEGVAVYTENLKRIVE